MFDDTGGSHHLSTQGGARLYPLFQSSKYPIVSPFFLANFPLFMPISPLFIYIYIFCYIHMFPPGEITIFAAKASHLSHFFFRLKKIIP